MRPAACAATIAAATGRLAASQRPAIAAASAPPHSHSGSPAGSPVNSSWSPGFSSWYLRSIGRQLPFLPGPHVARPLVAEGVEGGALRAVEAEQVEEALGHQQRDLAPRLLEPAGAVDLHQVEDGERIVEEELLGERHPLLAAVALGLAVVLGEFHAVDRARFPQGDEVALDPLGDRPGDPVRAPQDAEAHLPARHVVAGEEEGVELGRAAQVARDRRHEVGEDLLVPFAGSVEQGEEAELVVVQAAPSREKGRPRGTAPEMGDLP